MSIMNRFFNMKWSDIIKKGYGLAVLILCLSCIVICAHYSAITLDEAHTYVDYVEKIRPGFMGEFFEQYDGRANNHLLNTVLIYFVDLITGIHYDEFLVRFPNVCFGFFFGFFCLYLYQKRKISTVEFSLLMLNASINSAFALARGYGIATCLTMFAVYFVKLYVESDYTEYKALSIAILFFTLAESANTVVLLITFSIAIVLLAIMLKRKVLVSYLKQSWLFLTPTVVLNLLLLGYHMYVSMDGEGKALASFHGNPLEGIIGCFVGMYTWKYVRSIACIFICLLICAALFGIIKKRQIFFTVSFISYFVICSLMAVVLGKGMPSNLALLPTCPMIIFSINEILVLIKDCAKKLRIESMRIIETIFIVIFIPGLVVQFCRRVDFTMNNDLREYIYDSVMGGNEGDYGSDDLYGLHLPFYHRQFYYRYGYDIYAKKYTMENMPLADTLWMLENQDYDILLDINNKGALNKYKRELEKLGVDVKNISENTDFIIINRDAEEEIEYLNGFKGTDNITETGLGTMNLFYGENGSYGVYMNGSECLVVKPEEQQPELSIAVWNEREEESFDYKVFAGK